MIICFTESMQLFKNSGGGNTSSYWPHYTGRKLSYRLTAGLLLTSFTITSPSDCLRWTPPNTSLDLLVSAAPVGRLSKRLGFNESRREVLLSLFKLAYSFRFRLPALIAAGFGVCYFFFSWIPWIEINAELEEEEEDEEEEDADIELEVEFEEENTDTEN